MPIRQNHKSEATSLYPPDHNATHNLCYCDAPCLASTVNTPADTKRMTFVVICCWRVGGFESRQNNNMPERQKYSLILQLTFVILSYWCVFGFKSCGNDIIHARTRIVTCVVVSSLRLLRTLIRGQARTTNVSVTIRVLHISYPRVSVLADTNKQRMSYLSSVKTK